MSIKMFATRADSYIIPIFDCVQDAWRGVQYNIKLPHKMFREKERNLIWVLLQRIASLFERMQTGQKILENIRVFIGFCNSFE